MHPESLEGDLPPDAGPDAARESSGTQDPGSITGGAGEGSPGLPADADHEPGHGPTADEATGVTGEPDDGDDGTA
jgi:hypothetical protein